MLKPRKSSIKRYNAYTPNHSDINDFSADARLLFR